MVASFLLSPIYIQLYQTGGVFLMTVATLSASFLAWLLTSLLFLVFGSGVGAVPAMVAGQGRRYDMTSSAGEIGAFLIARLIVMVAFYAVNSFVLVAVYTWLRQSGQMYLTVPLSLATALVTATVFFLLFIALRAALPALPDGGASMGFGRAIATVFAPIRGVQRQPVGILVLRAV